MKNLLLVTFAAASVLGQTTAGPAAFASRCSGCHGADGNGGEHAPSVFPALFAKNDAEITTIIKDGVLAKGMPAFKQLPDSEVSALVAQMRTMQQSRRGRPDVWNRR